MSKKYFRILILFAGKKYRFFLVFSLLHFVFLDNWYKISITAVIVGINSSNKIKQCEEKNIDHDVIDGDNTISLINLFNDSFSTMNQVRNRNISIDEIPFEDDSYVKFHDIKLTKVPCKANSTLMGYHCALDKYLEV